MSMRRFKPCVFAAVIISCFYSQETLFRVMERAAIVSWFLCKVKQDYDNFSRGIDEQG
jgi:hypothetical protein